MTFDRDRLAALPPARSAERERHGWVEHEKVGRDTAVELLATFHGDTGEVLGKPVVALVRYGPRGGATIVAGGNRESLREQTDLLYTLRGVLAEYGGAE